MKQRHPFESLVQFKAALLTFLALGLAAGSAAAAAPTIFLAGPDATDITDKQQNFYHPFSNVTISDPDGSPVTVSILFSPTGLGSFHTPLPGGASGSAGSFTIAKASAASVTTTIRALIFDSLENQIDIGSSAAVTFTFWATDTNGVSSTTNSDRNVTITPTNDPPTITGAAATTTTDKISVTPFTGVTVADVDNRGTQPLSLTISLDDTNKGTFSNFATLGFSQVSSGFTMDGTSNEVTAAIRQLIFVPTENRVPVDLAETTIFSIAVSDTVVSVTNNSTTVAATSINDPPVLGGVSTARQAAPTGSAVTPFSTATISDVDPNDNTNRSGGQSLTLTVTMTGANLAGQLEGPGGFGGTAYQVNDVTPPQAASILQGLVYRAPSLPVSGTNTYGFNITVTDGHGGSATNANAKVDVFSSSSAPTLSGTQSGQHVNDNTTIAPFSTVTVHSSNGTPVNASIQIDHDFKGQFTNLSGFVKLTSTTPATYVASGPSDQITAAMHALLFQPTPNRLNGASNETAVFTILLSSSGKTNAPDSSTTVIVAPVNDRPVITGISPPGNMQDNSTVPPFPTVSISDVDELGNQSLTVFVTLDYPANGNFDPGNFSATNGSVVTSFVQTNGGYRASGSPSNVTAAIRHLVFVPTPQLLAIGLTTNINFSITADDGYGGVTVNNATVIRVAAVSGGPFVSVPSPQQQPLSLALVNPLHALGSVTISAALPLKVTVQVTNTAGFFSSNSLVANNFTNNAPGSYVFTGSASNATVSIQNLEFVPDTNLLAGTVIRFTISAVDATPNSYTATLDIKLRQTQRSWIVTKITDYPPGDTDPEAFGTLRKAVEDASSNDHITFDLRSADPNLPDYPAAIRLAQTIVLDKNLTFDGPGADALAIRGDDTNGVALVQLFIVQPGIHVTINRLTLTKGYHSFSGGAIEVNPGAGLKLSYCAVTDSIADIWGGGIDVNGGSLSMDHCLVHGNTTSTSLGQGGGGISIYTDQDCSIVNTTFSANQQLSPGGLGGGALYVENSDVGHEMDVWVTSCTFRDNSDAGGSASSIRPNVFDANVFVQNCLFADGQGENLYLDGSGMIISLGGNFSDDSTRTIFSIGGASYDVVILDAPHDKTNQTAGLLPFAANGGPTRTFALSGISPAIDFAISNETTATFFDTLGTDQRGYWRKDGHPDIGAFEVKATNRIIVEEISFNPPKPNTNDEFIEFYVPRDSAPLNLANYQVYVGGAWRHTFASQILGPGQAVVLFSKDAVNTFVPSGVYSQISSNRLSMDDNADTITLKNPSTQTVFEVSFVGSFGSSDTTISRYVTNLNQSIVLSPQFQGSYLPYQLVAQNEGGPGGRTNDISGPGVDVAGNSLGGGNFPPRAFNDAVATDAHTPLLSIPAPANDLDLDVTDVIRVVGVGVTNGFPAGAAGIIIPPGEASLSSTSRLGASVMVVSNGAAISYDPGSSQSLLALPEGSILVDTFQYSILDSSNGVDHVRGTSALERSNNIVKATATVSVTVTGVNSPPTPQPDSVATNPLLTTAEDAVLDFTTLTNLLANDTDPNTDDFGKLNIVAIHPTSTYSNAVQIVSALGAWVTLDLRFDPAQAHITYDPRPSAILNELSTNHSLVDTFYYAVMDTHGAIGSASVGITVWGINDTPTAQLDQLATDEDTLLRIPARTLLGNDTDPDTNDVVQLVAVSTPSLMGASVVIAGTDVIYNPAVSTSLNALARKEIANDSFSYVMTDGAGGYSTSSVTVVVTGVNDHPVAAAYAFTIDEDTLLSEPALGVLLNSYDPDVNGLVPDDSIRILAASRLTAAGAPVTLNANGSFSYDPRVALDWLPANSNWVDSFAYTLLDGSLTMANDDVFSVQRNSANIVLPVLANDVTLAGTGGHISITSVSLSNQGGTVAVSAAGDALTYTPAIDFSGPEILTYSISDGQGGTDSAQVTVVVTANAINANLIANPDWFTVSRGTTVNLDVLANDNILPASGGTLTILDVSPTSSGGIASLNGAGLNNSIIYTPDAARAVPFTETFTYRISGGGTIQATGTVTLTVVTNVLTANDDNFTVLAESGNTVLDVLANDRILPAPNANLTIISVQQTNGLAGVVAINNAGTRLLYKPRIGVFNQQEPFFTYTVSDGAGGSATATVSIMVEPGGLFANDDIFTVMKNSSNALAVLNNDAILPNSGETLVVTDTGLGVNAPDQGGSVGLLDAQTLAYTPATDFVGLETFTYEITDGTVARAQGHVRVRVLDTAVLMASPDAFNVAQNSGDNVLDVLRNDFRLPRTPGALAITSLDKTGLKGTVAQSSAGAGNFLFYKPAPGFIGTERFGYTCSDQYGNTGSTTVTVVVGGLLTHPDQFSVLSDSAGNQLDVLANDVPFPDATSVRLISGLGQPDQGGTVTANATATLLIYSPSNLFVGTEHFTYQVSDDSGKTYAETVTIAVVRAGSDRDTNTVVITVLGVNDPPTITGTISAGTINDKQTIHPFPNVTVGDVDDQGQQRLTATVTFDPSHGLLLGAFRLTAPGTYSFSGTPADVTAALRGLVYDPIENRIIVPTSENTTFLLSVDDHFVSQPVTDSATTVTVVAVNDPPIISGTLSNITVYHRWSVKPFAGVTITELDDSTLQPLTVTVSLNDATHGFLTSLGGFVDNSGGVYTLSGVTAAQASAALRGLVFFPTTNGRIGPGQSETTRFQISVNDGFAPPVIDNNTAVIAIHEYVAKLTANDGVAGDNFGAAVAARADVVVVGAPLDDDHGNSSGAAYIYVRDRMLPDHWTQFQKLVPADGAAGDQFGGAVSISGDSIVVAARFRKETTSAGAVYVFERTSGVSSNWVQSKKVVPFDGANSDDFGSSVSIDHDTLVVGADLDDDNGTSSGSAYLYARNLGGTNNWGLIKKLHTTDAAAGDQFGNSVSINGDAVAVGAHLKGGIGSAYVFSRDQDGADQWGQVKRLQPSDGLASDEFGFSVSVFGDTVIVGAPRHGLAGNDAGASYVFERDLNGANNWGQRVEILSPKRLNNDQFGYSVSISREKFVGSLPFSGLDNQSKYGTAFAFGRDIGGSNNWGILQELQRPDPVNNAQFGISVAIGQDTAVVGVNAGSGAAYIYRLKYDNAPLLLTPIPNQTATTNTPFTFTLSSDTFADPDVHDALTLSAALADGSALPGWLNFSPATGTLSGTPVSVASYTIRVTATDEDGASVTVTFDLTVSGINSAPWIPVNLSIADGPSADQAVLSYDRARYSVGQYYLLETSTDLLSWGPGGSLVLSESISPVSALIEHVTLQVPKNLPALFFRLKYIGPN